MRNSLVILILLLLFGSAANAATFTVTNTLDSGTGSLRQAIIDANSSPVPDLIEFSIPGNGIREIRLTTPLPAITGTTHIDGYTQPGSIKPGATWPAKIQVVLNGSGMAASGLQFAPGNIQ